MKATPMTKDDTAAFHAADPVLALALLTRLPLPRRLHGRLDHWLTSRPAASAAWAWPLVGVIVGLLGALAAGLGAGLSLPPGVQAGLALAAMMLATGAMHEDGLADCADGFWGGWTRARRLEIMKDSQIGTFGVLALLICVGLRWQLLAELAAQGTLATALVAAAVISRAAMVPVMAALPPARETGLSQQTGKPPRAALWGALGIALVAALAAGPFLTLLGVAALATLAVAWLARAKVGGQTGDVLGATQQTVELGLLMVLLT